MSKGKIPRTCEICETVVYKKPSDIALGRGRFCSRNCYGEWISLVRSGENSPNWKRVEKQCGGCEKKILVRPHKLKSNQGFYCSQSCFFITHSGESNSRFARIEMKCEGCDRTFYVKPSHQDRRRFCSMECKGKWQSENNFGESHPSWLGGKSFEPYPPTFNEKFKRLIRKRDGYACLLCQKWGNQVHHINYIKEDTNPQNCVTLCLICNVKANYNRPKWQALIQSLMEVKYGFQYAPMCAAIS